MPKQNERSFVILVTLLSCISLFATDIYLPALPQIAEYFHCTHAQIQMSFSIFLLGLAACHLVTGILADRFGRRKVLIAGFILFSISSLMCAFATTLSQFMICRLGQAMGGGSGSVISRALIVDRYNRQDSVKIFSTIFPIVSVSAAIAPLVGGYMIYFWSWRVPFVFVAIVGLIILGFILSMQHELAAQHAPEPSIAKEKRGRQNFFEVVTNLEFVGYVLIIAACFSAFRSYIVESPFVFSAQGFGVEQIGRFYLIPSATYVFGNLTAKKLVGAEGIASVLRKGIFCFVVGGILLILSAYFFPMSPYPLILSMSILTLGNGFLFPVGSTGAMTAASPRVAGTASGILGASGFVTSALCITWVGDLCHGDAIKLAFFILGPVVVGLGSFLLLSYLNNRPQETTSPQGVRS